MNSLAWKCALDARKPLCEAWDGEIARVEIRSLHSRAEEAQTVPRTMPRTLPAVRLVCSLQSIYFEDGLVLLSECNPVGSYGNRSSNCTIQATMSRVLDHTQSKSNVDVVRYSTLTLS